MQFSDGYYGHHPMADYYNAMDPETYGQDSRPEGTTLGVQDIGMSVPMGISAGNVAGVYSKIRMGAGNIEIQFPGGGPHGQRQAQTPGMYGADQRQAFRELGAINEVRFTTHASMGVMGMTGTDQQGNFALTRAKMGQHEIERAVDFAADVAGGGSVVVHTGEYERPLTDMYVYYGPNREHTVNLSRQGSEGRLMFKKRITEPADAQFDLIDDRTGQAMKTVQKDRLVAQPVWLKAKEDKWGIDQKGNKCFIRKGGYVDYEGRLLLDPFDPTYGRVPEYDEATGRFKMKYMHFDEFKDEAEEKNQWFKRLHEREPDYYERITPVEAFLHATLDANEGHSRGWALQYGHRADDHLKAIEELRKLERHYEELERVTPKEELWKIMRSDNRLTKYSELGQFITPQVKKPTEIINRLIAEQQRELEFSRQASSAQEQQARDLAETKTHIVEPTKYIEKWGVQGYAEAGLRAMSKTKDPNNPIVLTMENIFPERFGGHPQELKWLIQKSRETMVRMLTEPTMLMGESEKESDLFEKEPGEGRLKLKPGKSPWYNPDLNKEEAEKLAEKHIKATLDTGHLNIWRKFWQQKPGLTPEQNEEAFRKWYLEQVEDLAKSGMIGNVHLADNFGYQDDHVAPGQGNAPIKEAVEILRKHGYDRAWTVEPGADASTDISDFHGLMKAWKHFGSPIYGVGMRVGAPQTWSDVHYSYFGQNKPPYYIFGGYAPSNDWTLWSAVPME